MNGQKNENNSARPGEGGGFSPVGGPAPFNAGDIGNNQPGVSNKWSPNAAPTPGPINGSPAPSQSASAMPPVPPQDNKASVPPPPTGAQYQVKTLASDSESIKASGGMETTPKTFTPASTDKEKVYDPSAPATAPVKRRNSSKLILVAGIIIIVAGLGALGFMFLKPLFTTPVETTPLVTPEESSAGLLEGETTTSAETETPIKLPVHVSFLTVPADSVMNASIDELTLVSLKEAIFPLETTEEEEGAEVIEEEPLDPLADGAVQELVISLPEALLAFSDFIGVTLPDMNTEAIALAFEDDFTLFIHQDGTNKLLGLIAKVKSEAEPEALAAVSTALEASPNLANFYATDPGAISAFKDGAVSGDPVRYAPFSTAGYAFNYGWFKDAGGADYLVAASSYKTIVEAIERAGF